MFKVLVALFVLETVILSALLVQRSRRARSAETLQENEARFREMAHRAPVMLWSARPDTGLDYFNDTFMEFTGLPLDRLSGEGWVAAVHPNDVDHRRHTYGEAFDARAPFFMEYRVRRADGIYRWILDSGVPRYAADGTFSGYIGASVDITDHRAAENALLENQGALEDSYREIQRLAGSLIAAQDAERARIARDLHDGFSQQLAALSITLSGLRRRVAAGLHEADFEAGIASIQQRTDGLVDSVRSLSHDLHPDVLKYAGLTAALSEHCAALSESQPVPVTCIADGDFDSLGAEAALCLYRVAQEAVHNALKHSGGRHLGVRLQRTGDLVELMVSDDGRGFDIARRRNGLGLVSVNERVRLAGGTLSVVTELNKGTQIRVRLPMSQPKRSPTPVPLLASGSVALT